MDVHYGISSNGIDSFHYYMDSVFSLPVRSDGFYKNAYDSAYALYGKEISGNSWLSVEEWNPILASEDADTHIIGTLKTASRRCVACSPNGTLSTIYANTPWQVLHSPPGICQRGLAGFSLASPQRPENEIAVLYTITFLLPGRFLSFSATSANQ